MDVIPILWDDVVAFEFPSAERSGMDEISKLDTAVDTTLFPSAERSGMDVIKVRYQLPRSLPRVSFPSAERSGMDVILVGGLKGKRKCFRPLKEAEWM